MTDFEFLDTSCQFLTWTVAAYFAFLTPVVVLGFWTLVSDFECWAVVADFEFRTLVSEFGFWTIGPI